MGLENVLPGKKTYIAAVLVFVGGGLIYLGLDELGKLLVATGTALGFVGLRLAK